VAQLYPQTLGTHFSRLLRHAWVTVGLFEISSPHGGEYDVQSCLLGYTADRRFRGAYCLHHQASVTSVDNHFTRQYIPEDNSEPWEYSLIPATTRDMWPNYFLTC
jgi:hypothetical protein